jgi:dipeptidyl-peptidase-4
VTTAADSSFLRAFAETRGFLLGRPTRAQITPDGTAVLFLRSPPRDPTHHLYETVVSDGLTRELCSPATLLGGEGERLSDAERARRERRRVTDFGFTSFQLSPEGARVLLPLSGQLFLLERDSGAVRSLPLPGTDAVLDPRFSPDGRRVAFVHSHDVWVVAIDGGAAEPVTTGGTRELSHGLAEFVAEEEMGRHEGYWWSPDGDRLAFAEVDVRGVERFAIADPARPARAPLLFSYPRPGRANARVRLGLAAVGAGGPAPPLWVRWDDDRYPYLARVLWDTAQAPLSLLVQTRDQREAALLAVDERTGETRPLVVERDEQWINLDRDLPRWLPDGSGLLWVSERRGARALELRRPDGTLEVEVVPPEAGFLGLVHLDPDGREVVVVNGDALVSRVERVELSTDRRDGVGRPSPAAPRPLISDPADHSPIFSRDGSHYVDARTTAERWPEIAFGRGDGTMLGTLPASAEEPPFRVNLELTTVGARAFHAALIRPRAFTPGRRYPVIVQVYGGPHALTVKADQRQYLLHQWIADQGAVVVCVDNRGTPRRGRAWERAIKGRLGEVPLEDQVAALEALGARYPELDLARVGIYGWSFGGYLAALAVLRRPDVFKAAAAGAPVVDWQDYDTHYTERYLDLPEQAPDAYRAASLLTHAAGLERPLLLVHGTADDNVYFFHSLKLADALLRAGREFSFLPLPGVTHQVPEPVLRARVWERMIGFLFHHL